MAVAPFRQLGVIGCGLMGGSFALALRQAGLVQRVVGYSKSPSTVERARRLGVIDIAAESALLAVSGSDLVLLSVPVAATEPTLRAIRHGLEPTALLMDVGSTKRDVADAARRVLRDRLPNFVPAHPIAGKESAGVDHADAGLYSGRKLILTPLAQTAPEAVRRATEVWQAVGSQVLCMTPENHDAAFAAVSHLPHLLAFAYFDAVARQPAGHEFLSLAGPGFRDFTRIAASDPAVWRDILASNREEVLRQLDRLRHALDDYEAVLRAADLQGLEQRIRSASTARSAWSSSPTGSTGSSGFAAPAKPPRDV